ncbi:MAG: thiT [Haloplasmataceae bacterium]|jgi:thiamine transporter|nr:thiT [Haloplasmataceae bacterium]
MKNHKTVLLIAEIAIVTSLAIVFDFVANMYSINLFPNGGSVSIAMLPIFVLALRRGVVPGVVSGLLLGFLQTIITTPYIAPLNPVLGYLLDYPIGYGLVGLAGLGHKFVQSKNKNIGLIAVIVSVIIGGTLRTISVTVSGVYCWLSNWSASILYNFPYMLPSILVSGVLAVVIYFAASRLFITENISQNTIDIE